MTGLRIFWLQFRIDWLDQGIALWLGEIRAASAERERLLARIEELRKRQARATARRTINAAIARRPL